jgi:hypothetical protein
MTEDERVKYINDKSATHLHEWLEQIEDEKVSEEDFLGSLYGAMVAASLLGFNLKIMSEYAIAGAERLSDLIEKEELTKPTE